MADAWQDTITNAVSDASHGFVAKWVLIADMLQVGFESIEESDD